ncbi:hypothetical protein [Streptacidiphilus sp. EB129]|uniref:hypothetical protein n=1 Tax=Streptacidiphilus sp. EB129 TaxID=3156262 RepID=UPI003515B308
MYGYRKLVWLGLTPEPERELPHAVAALRTQATGSPAVTGPPPATAAAESRRVQRLILHGSQRGWLRYLAEVTALVADVAAGTAPGDPRTAVLAGEVVLSHHHMLIGLPGPGYDRAAADRTTLTAALRTLHERLRTDSDTHPQPIRPRGDR